MSTQALAALKQATEGLLYMSESDEPFETVHLEAGKEIIEHVRPKADIPVQEMSLHRFFKDLTEDKAWHGEEEKRTVKRYRDLFRAINEHLSQVRVMRVGKIQVDIYIVGRTKDGNWAGVKTKAVET